MLFKKLFRVLVVGGAVAAAQTSCATGSSAKTGGTATAGRTDSSAADGGTAEATSDQASTQSSGGGGVMGW